MAGPFSKAPTFGEYLEWMRINTSFSYKCGIIPPSTTFILIHDENDIPYIHLLLTYDDQLIPPHVKRLDEVLGTNSSFFKI